MSLVSRVLFLLSLLQLKMPYMEKVLHSKLFLPVKKHYDPLQAEPDASKKKQ